MSSWFPLLDSARASSVACGRARTVFLAIAKNYFNRATSMSDDFKMIHL